MAGRSKYSEEDRARCYVVLQANGGNVKAAARELELPVTTVRRWRGEFEAEGPPDLDVVEEAVEDYLGEMEKIRNKALRLLDAKLPEASAKDTATIFGILDDKVSRARGIADATVKHELVLPDVDTIREALGAVVQGAIEAAGRRQEEIVEAEIVEAPRALPSGS